jgi:hypothetical protein
MAVLRYSTTTAVLTLPSVSYCSRKRSSAKRRPEAGGCQPEGRFVALAFPKGQTTLLFAKKIVKWVSRARAQYAMTFTSN